MASLEAIHYVKGSVYFSTPIAAIHYNKQSVVELRKFEAYSVY